MLFNLQTNHPRLTAFFNKFGSLKSPTCAKCLTPVSLFSIGYNPEKNLIVATVKCHDRAQHMVFDYEKIMQHNKIIINKAFNQPSQLYNGEEIISL